MSDSRLPTEVELAYEVMPCSAMRTSLEPSAQPHPCTYFREWGTYHSYDYQEDGPPPEPGIEHTTVYVGRAPLVPEILSGCRKAPIISVGINPNLPGWWSSRRSSVNPLFDDYKQYAHYFRYRSIAKLEVPRDEYESFGGGSHDRPIVNSQGDFGTFEMDVPPDESGDRVIPVQVQPQSMYEAYQDLLNMLADEMGWDGHELRVGEDLAYGNMVACPSAKWVTRPQSDPRLPVMTSAQRRGIVGECFRERKYFLRQLFQSLPAAILIFSRSTARAFIGELQARFVEGDPSPDESIQDLMQRTIRLRYGHLSDGSPLEARVIFAPHITGDPANYGPAREHVVEQLVAEAQPATGRLRYNPATKHLTRGQGACVFCTMLEIGPCDYEEELVPLSDTIELTAASPASALREEKVVQEALLNEAALKADTHGDFWDEPDDKNEPDGSAPASTARPRAPRMAGEDTSDVAVGFLADEVDEDDGPTFLLKGSIVTMDGDGTVIPNGTLVVSQGEIKHVLAEDEPIPVAFQTARAVETSGTIFPGLIDLHNHLAYNVIPLWKVPEQFPNRETWQRHREYDRDVKLPITLALGKYAITAEALVRYVEVKAIVGGVTTGQGLAWRGVTGGPSQFDGLMRNVERTKDQRLPRARTRVPNVRDDQIEDFRDALRDCERRGAAYLYHLAEGTDDSSRAHFLNLQANGLLESPLVGIHSLALRDGDLEELAAAGCGVCWSPLSNLLLYGATIDPARLSSAGVEFTIGCDWSPSGSKNLLQELKVAAFLNAQSGEPFSSHDLVAAVTTNAALRLGWQAHLGSIRSGALADFVVIRGRQDDPYQHLIAATEDDICLVGIHGRARYGDFDLVKSIHPGPDTDLEVITVGGRTKGLYLAHPESPINQVTYSSARETLTRAMSDLHGFVQEQEEDAIEFATLGVPGQRFSLVLDNELEELLNDPLTATDASDVDVEFAAESVDDMATSLPLDDLTVVDADDDYWERVDGQRNLPPELKSQLKDAY